MTAVQEMNFGGLRICFDHSILRPRPWTAAQARWASDLLRTAPPGDVLELCTGAGHLGLLAIAETDRRLVAVDVSPVAVDFARSNAEAAGLTTRVEVREGQIDAALRPGEEFAVIIADPPWVRRAEVLRHPQDPVLAIDGGPDGLDLARRCLDVIDRHLADGGSAVLQVGTSAQVARLRSSLLSDGRRLQVLGTREFPGRGVLVHITRVGQRESSA